MSKPKAKRQGRLAKRRADRFADPAAPAWPPGQTGIVFWTSCRRVRCIELPLRLDGTRDIRISRDGAEVARCRTPEEAGAAYRRACEGLR